MVKNDDYKRSLDIAARLRDLGFEVDVEGSMVRLRIVTMIPSPLTTGSRAWVFDTVVEAYQYAVGLRDGLRIATTNVKS